jgi:hypothetical protein
MSRLSRLALASPRLLVIPALVAFGAMAVSIPTPASAQVALGVSVQEAPPPLIEYDQPPLPGPGYLWNPGYWAYGDAGYYWVPGTWAEPPAVGLLWTPPYWGFVDGAYLFNAGYWGATVGFYGGINYGFGFGGFGYEGGFWRDGAFNYNRAANNFGGVRITNVYNRNIVNVRPGGAAFNGRGGIDRRPMASELAAAHDRHIDPTPAQMQHREAASHNEALRASVNHGHPAIAATARAGDLSHGAGAAHEAGAHAAEAHSAAEHAGAAHSTASHAASHGASHPTSHPTTHHTAAPHAAAPRAAAPHATAPHATAPRPSAPRPAPHASAPRPAPHPSAPRPAPHPSAPPPHHH